MDSSARVSSQGRAIRQPVRFAAVVSAATAILVGLGGIVANVANGELFVLAFAVPSLLWAGLGGTILWNDPSNRIGWIFILNGVATAFGSAAEGYAETAGLPGQAWAALVAEASFPLIFSAMIVFLPLLFPNGRLVSSRWRLVLYPAIVFTWLTTGAEVLAPGRLDCCPFTNPMGVESLRTETRIIGGPDMFGVMALLGVLAASSVVIRFRRSRGLERLQMKWFTYAVGVMVGAVIAGTVFGASGVEPPVLVVLLMFGGTFALLPVAAGFAVLRYRLYGIDRIINRTLVYTLLTVVIGLIYLGTVLVLQQLLSQKTERSDIAVAASTLGAAALIGPIRRRIQSLIDRSFYRNRYNAEREVHSFIGQLRKQVNLGEVRRGVIRVVDDTMSPERVILWMRRVSS